MSTYDRTCENLRYAGLKEDVYIKFECRDDLPETKLIRPAAESAYRRGYYQGYTAAIRDVQNKHSLTTLGDFLFNKIYRWRLKKHRGKHECPPE